MATPQDSPPISTLDVRTPSGTYQVIVGAGTSRTLLDALPQLRAQHARRVIVSSPTVWRLHGERFGGVSDDEPILIPDGERFKNLATVGRIYDGLIRAGADRGAVLVAIGGGVVGDVAGFAAATYLRGIPVVQVPTTLLAQVDSAIGGKVGVNHPLGKNLIGAFHQPLAVVADPEVLRTLPRREFRAGLYEVIKYGVIASRDLFDRVSSTLKALFGRENDALLPLIRECGRIKGRVVEQDERESGIRRSLNFGHTIGHALEAVTKYKRFRHGEAVAYGMLAAADVAVARGVLAREERDALAAVITRMGPLPAVTDLPADQVLDAVARDKKVIGGRLHFVLPSAIGTVMTVADVSTEELAAALAAIRNI